MESNNGARRSRREIRCQQFSSRFCVSRQKISQGASPPGVGIRCVTTDRPAGKQDRRPNHPENSKSRRRELRTQSGGARGPCQIPDKGALRQSREFRRILVLRGKYRRTGTADRTKRVGTRESLDEIRLPGTNPLEHLQKARTGSQPSLRVLPI